MKIIYVLGCSAHEWWIFLSCKLSFYPFLKARKKHGTEFKGRGKYKSIECASFFEPNRIKYNAGFAGTDFNFKIKKHDDSQPLSPTCAQVRNFALSGVTCDGFLWSYLIYVYTCAHKCKAFFSFSPLLFYPLPIWWTPFCSNKSKCVTVQSI